MSILELLEQELAALQTAQQRDRAELQKKIAVVQQQANLIEQKDALLSEQSATIRKQEEKLAAQQLEINRLIQQAFGRRSERYLESPQQLKIDFGGGPEVTDAADGLQQAVDDKQLADEAVAATAEMPSTRPAAPPKKKKKRDESLPANLPRIEKIVDVFPGDKICTTHGEKTLIGYDVRESLVYIPPLLEIRVTKFPKYACPNQPECKVTQAERPERLVEGDRYDTSVAAEIISANPGYHFPLYRKQTRPWRFFFGAAAPNYIQTSFSLHHAHHAAGGEEFRGQRLGTSSQHTAEYQDGYCGARGTTCQLLHDRYPRLRRGSTSNPVDIPLRRVRWPLRAHTTAALYDSPVEILYPSNTNRPAGTGLPYSPAELPVSTSGLLPRDRVPCPSHFHTSAPGCTVPRV